MAESEDRPVLTLDFVRRQTGYDGEFFEVQINVGGIQFQTGDLTARECDQVRVAAGVPALDDDTRREVEALIEQHQWAIDREHPCSGACLGCGAGVDESCDPDCGCDEGEMTPLRFWSHSVR